MNNVITFKPKNSDKPHCDTEITSKKNYEQKHCKHIELEIDEQYRVVKCLNCDCIISAFDVLLSRATDAEYVIKEIVALNNQRKESRLALEKLLKEERNAKVRLRTAKDTLAFIENDIAKKERGDA